VLFPAVERSQDRWLTYLVPISEVVQMVGALLDILVLREMQRLPEGGK